MAWFRKLTVGGTVAAVVTAAATLGAGAQQGKDLSDKSITTLMNYAWTMTPPRFTSPDGKVIEVDKSKPQDVIVPVEIGRDVIRVARLSAFAQMCGLVEEQGANYQTLMKREAARKKWSDQQTLYISQLHLFTVMTLTGQVQVVETEGEDGVVVKQQAPAARKPASTCSDTERKKVAEQIKAYVVASEGITTGSTAAAAEPKKP